MRINRCVPLPGHGRGLVARFGDLVAVSDGLGAGPDPLLGVIEHVDTTAGDGAALVRTAARAVLASDGQRAFACAGTTRTDELIVLVSGDAVATAIVDGGQPVLLAGSSSLLPVSRVFTGAVIDVTIALGESTAELRVADGPYRLDGGIVHGAGLAITVTSHADAEPSEPELPEPEQSEPKLPEPELREPKLREPKLAETGLEITLRGQTTIMNFQPPPGVLVLDDGTGFALDADYVIGREPALDTDVAAGRARPLRIADPEGTVSRLHLRISVLGEQVMVSDLGSGNGSVLCPPAGQPLRLIPNEPTAIEPGARIILGDRSFEYLSRAARPLREG